VAIQERVSTLERLVADVAVQQAKTEKALDRLVADTAASREQAREDREAFELSFDRRMARFEEATRLDIQKQQEATRLGIEKQDEATRLAIEKQHEATRLAIEKHQEATRLDIERHQETTRLAIEKHQEATRLDIEGHQETTRIDNEAFRQSMRESAERFEQGLRQDTEASKRAMDALFEKYAREGRQDRKALNKKWGELANKLGTVAEDVVAPNIPTVARRYFGIRRLDSFAIRTRKRSVTDLETVREFDVVAYSLTHLILNETKASPTIGDAQAFVSLIPSIPEYFPHAVGKELVPIFSSFSIGEDPRSSASAVKRESGDDPRSSSSAVKRESGDDISTYLTRHGVYCMVMRGGTMELSNFDEARAARSRL